MTSLHLFFMGGVLIAMICSGALIAYWAGRLSEDILTDKKERELAEKRQREHDLWVLAHFGKLIQGLHDRDGIRIDTAIKAINVEISRRHLAVEKHLARPPRQIGVGRDRLAGIP